MSAPSLRRLSLADLDDVALEGLVRHGEDLLVERKRDLPKPPRFGAAAASLANTLGGWILVGVADDGTVAGWEKPARLDLQSHLGAILRAEVDPLPPFIADMRELDGKQIGVVRVFPSMDSPHIVRGTGAVYVRSSKGKEPVDDHRTLLDLARRGEEADVAAHRRLAALEGVGYALRPPDFKPPGVAFADEEGIRYIARAAPLSVTPALADWPLTRRAADTLSAIADRILPAERMPFDRTAPSVTPFGRGLIVSASQETGIGKSDAVTLAADSGGVFGLSVRRGAYGERPSIRIQAVLDTELRPLAESLGELLVGAEAFGRTIVDLWVVMARGVQVADVAGNRPPREMHVSRELTIPADADEIHALAESWHRELQRILGIAKFEA